LNPWYFFVLHFTQESQGKYVTQRNTKGSRSTQESQGKYVKQRNTKGSRFTQESHLCYILTLTLLCRSWTLGISLCYILTLTLLCRSWTLGISLCYILTLTLLCKSWTQYKEIPRVQDLQKEVELNILVVPRNVRVQDLHESLNKYESQKCSSLLLVYDGGSWIDGLILYTVYSALLEAYPDSLV
jgi:hypothetical protein